MENTKRLKKWIPEIYLTVSVIYYWIMTGTLVNGVAIILLMVLAALVILKNNLLGTIISSLFLMLNLYLVLALISELMEFPTFDRDAQIMLLFGSVYLGLNIFLSTLMLLKWQKNLSIIHA